MQLKKKFEILMIIFAIIVGFYSLFLAPFLTPFVLGGVILQGILGGFSGKVGPVVGAKWKDVDYMRGYVVPENPNTVGQQAVRTKFSALVAIARDFLSTIIQPYWDPFNSSMSGFNKFISKNYPNLTIGNLLDETAIFSEGTLEVATLLEAAKTGTTLALTWDDTHSGNGLDTDTIISGAYNNTTKILYLAATPGTRINAGINITIPTGDTAADFVAFCFATRGTGAELVVSDSSSVIGTTA
jgi:hypothetical protein